MRKFIDWFMAIPILGMVLGAGIGIGHIIYLFHLMVLDFMLDMGWSVWYFYGFVIGLIWILSSIAYFNKKFRTSSY